ESMGWDAFVSALDQERKRLGPIHIDNIVEKDRIETRSSHRLRVIDPRTREEDFEFWARDSVIEHKLDGFRGVHVRLKLGDITSTRARGLARIVRELSAGELRTSIGHHVFLPWVPDDRLYDLYQSLKQIEIGESGVGTVV